MLLIAHLLAGAVVTVALAWAAVLAAGRVPPTLENSFNPSAATIEVVSEWPGLAPAALPPPQVRLVAVTFGLTEEAWLLKGATMRRFHAGWPACALSYERWECRDERFTPAERAHLRSVWRAGIPLPWGGSPDEGPWRRLPVRPRWGGLALDVLLFGLVPWAAFCGWRDLRRVQRHRRGRCEGCGYPVGVSDLCTECGAPVRPRMGAAR